MHALKLTATALGLMLTAACSSGDEASAKDAVSDTSGAASAQKAMARTQGTTPSSTAKSVEEGEGCPSLAPAERWAKGNVEGYDFNSAFCGDFTGDGQPDALLVAYIPHGNSASHEVALFQNVNGALSYLRSVPDFFGEIKSATFNRGKIVLDTAVMNPGDPRSTPSGRKSFEVDTATGKFAEGIASSSQASSTNARSPEATATATRAQQGGSLLPIRQGYYAEGPNSCAAAMDNFTLGMFVRPERFEYHDVTIAILGISPRPTGEYVVSERMQGEGGSVAATSTVRVMNSNNFSRTLPDPEHPKSPSTLTYRFCSATPPRDWNF